MLFLLSFNGNIDSTFYVLTFWLKINILIAQRNYELTVFLQQLARDI